jgi:histidinol-phosphate phosphatase family protein
VRARALFLDRDGTLIVDTGYVRDPDTVTLLPGAIATLKAARALGFELVLVSNQSGVARGIISPAAFEAVQKRFEELLGSEGVVLDDVRFCLHGPDDGCACRKPAPGLLRAAAAERAIDLPSSVMVGDRESDMLAGKSAGCRTILLGGESAHADHAVASLREAVPILQKLAP